MAAIQVENLRFRWPKSQQDLLDLQSFEIKAGEKIFLQGPSGSGKTTLLNILSGVLNFQNGSLKILDSDMQKLSPSEKDLFRGNHMGFIFQLFNLLPFLSVAENIMLPLEFSLRKRSKVTNPEEYVKELMDHLELDPKKYFNQKVTDLSVGQQQRVAVARALIGQPEILIADEPTSSLDHDVRDKFIQLMLRECERNKTTVLFVSHDPSLQKSFDRVLSLKTLNKAFKSGNDI
jgi:putative ABC transport system ATP-binding protein